MRISIFRGMCIAVTLDPEQRLINIRLPLSGRPWLALGVMASVPWLISYYFVGVGGYVNYNHKSVEQSSSIGLVLMLAVLRLPTGHQSRCWDTREAW